ncbi:DUF2730 family protein [Vreelandella titanicae]|jgi:mevalonate kinase|uniref:DUF2730 family protein n=1 Tax=Vreelandella titanicae TaxID=664683 RepID=UPI001594DD9F|nr:DUF2730 family protein [Halomonas titanicae]NVE91557.1 DUF2730 family protein [Halomonas titanicae]|tara:strand:- start:1993 stop:2334 length:342 start_codon:yes stop_codon:yes gene_type:complete
MEVINWAAAKLFFDILQALILAGVSIYVWWINRTRATGKAITTTNVRIDDVEKRMVNLEHQVERLPDHEDIEKLQEQMTKTNLLLAEISAGQKAMANQVNRMDDYLMNHRGTK